jgi:hypothetical protein
MFHRGFFFGRLFMLLLIIGGAIAVGRGLYRSGFEQGFMQGMVFTADNGDSAPNSAAVPPDYRGWGPGHWNGFGAIERGLLGSGLMCLAFPVFVAFIVLFMFGGRRHRRGHHHAAWGHAHGGPGWWSRRDPDAPGPEKQPKDYL